jgi:hypothetical protein
MCHFPKIVRMVKAGWKVRAAYHVFSDSRSIKIDHHAKTASTCCIIYTMLVCLFVLTKPRFCIYLKNPLTMCQTKRLT